MKKAALVLGVVLVLVPAGPAGPAFADGIRDDQWHLQYLRVSEANDRTRGEGVTVAIVDNGVDRNHVDLSASVLPAISTSGVAVPSGDPDGHGTALAGLIAGQGHGANRQYGVLGIAPGADILPVVLGGPATPDPTGVRTVTPDQLAEGIELATVRGAKVIVVGYSVGGSERLAQAVREAQAADAIVVASDGNRAGEAFEPYPAAYDGVLAAVPLSRAGDVLVTSDSGRRLGFGVPGEEIMTTNTGGGYRVDAGSASVGELAAVVALVRAAYPKLPADEIVHRLSVTAVDAGDKGTDPQFGVGRVDLVPALTRTIPLAHPPAPSAAPSPSAPAASVAAPVAGPAPARSRGPLGWLLSLPLIAFIGVLLWYALRAEHRLRRSESTVASGEQRATG
ncbi:S8 family serine peptidase [Dactylosporangium aurantiacum]|uniref:S8 family serine peptidase n=1 Tax=Dactylosporangium aurantiacum TaxID=35754 RepID=A0A9Q9IHB5_9ACTN|nr:S8 family serine peptidase [Dactylosporangium aurantiacum]MDG6104875.1 S8 family serine peptidase [Dactylosporangium aurantiacum]UWZ55581.1 S8 family serine peptidase [Dactylosporangium aurantiacum]